jgi:hypothetical protein
VEQLIFAFLDVALTVHGEIVGNGWGVHRLLREEIKPCSVSFIVMIPKCGLNLHLNLLQLLFGVGRVKAPNAHDLTKGSMEFVTEPIGSFPFSGDVFVCHAGIISGVRVGASLF